MFWSLKPIETATRSGWTIGSWVRGSRHLFPGELTASYGKDIAHVWTCFAHHIAQKRDPRLISSSISQRPTMLPFLVCNRPFQFTSCLFSPFPSPPPPLSSSSSARPLSNAVVAKPLLRFLSQMSRLDGHHVKTSCDQYR